MKGILTITRKTAAALLFALCACFAQKAAACSPYGIPNLLNQTISGGNLLLTWESTTGYPCNYWINLELVCNNMAFTGTANYFSSYIQKPNANNMTYPVMSVSLSNFCPGVTYKFRARECAYASNTNCGNYTATFTFTMPGTLPALITNTTATPAKICSSAAQLNVNVTSGCFPYVYSWSPATGLSGTTISNPVATPTSTTTYTCTVDNPCTGQTSTSQVTVTVYCGLSVSVAGGSLCSGSCMNLTASASQGKPPYTYSWNPNIGTGPGPHQVCPTATTTYTVTVTDSLGVSYTDSAKVNVYPGIQVNSTSNNILCNGQGNGSATITVSGGGGNYTYLWNPGAQSTQNVTGLGQGTYTVIVTDQNGCSKTASVTINQPQPIVLTANGGFVCLGECINLTANATGGTGNITYTWNPGNLIGSTVNACPTATSNYTVTATDANGCTKTQVVAVNVNPKPTASFTANPTTGSIPLNVTFTNTSTGGNTYSWIFGDGNSSTSQNTSNTYTTGGTMTPMLIVTNTYGCKDTFYLTIFIDAISSIIVPNVFSPNGDGKNDQFFINTLGIKDMLVSIYDRWGLKMSDISSITAGWDGKAASGNDAPEGTYYYILTAHGMDNKQYDLKGYLLLLR